MANKVYLAVDLGAGSGRLMAAVFDSKTIQLEEVSRWASAPVKVGNSYHWDVQAIFNEIVSAVKKARSIYGDAIVSLGIDTWGVDYGLLDESDNLLNMPYIYRDSRT
ncbi:MAG: rhamnulokinase, partial [Opitutales bacterium]|nr:rhamnulokinase [Opitutales bacterium]